MLGLAGFVNSPTISIIKSDPTASKIRRLKGRLYNSLFCNKKGLIKSFSPFLFSGSPRTDLNRQPADYKLLS